MREMKKADRVMAIFWIALGLTISIWSTTFPFGGSESPGPGYLPLACGLILILLAMIMLFRTLKQKKGSSLKLHELLTLHRPAFKRVVLCLVGMLLSVALLQTLGFVLTMFIMILFMMRTIEPQKWRAALFYALIFSFSSLFVFQVLLKTALPKGIFGF